MSIPVPCAPAGGARPQNRSIARLHGHGTLAAPRKRSRAPAVHALQMPEKGLEPPPFRIMIPVRLGFAREVEGSEGPARGQECPWRQAVSLAPAALAERARADTALRCSLLVRSGRVCLRRAAARMRARSCRDVEQRFSRVEYWRRLSRANALRAARSPLWNAIRLRLAASRVYRRCCRAPNAPAKKMSGSSIGERWRFWTRPTTIQ